jgi:hypothetical protein
MIGAWKLTPEDVVEIKNLFATTNLSNQEIADQYGVAREHISHIRLGRRWNTENHSFLMKEEIEKKKPENFIILHILDVETCEVITAIHLSPDKLVALNDYITECYINESGGMTLILEIFA